MRIVSLVPSWTETLIKAGIEVVGRTSFCIHPSSSVADIQGVGGTKKVNWDKIQKLKPNYVLMDVEENTKEMADECPFPILTTHIRSINDVSVACKELSSTLRNLELKKLADRWEKVSEHPGLSRSLEKLPMPGMLEDLVPFSGQKRILYIIWKEPWMAICKDTFIGSVLEKLGYASYLEKLECKYPQIKLEDYSPQDYYLVFSSEPFPFQKKSEELKKLGYASCIVDGESYSWFGIRTLMFLEEYLEV